MKVNNDFREENEIRNLIVANIRMRRESVSFVSVNASSAAGLWSRLS